MTTRDVKPDPWFANLAAQSLRALPKLADELVDHMWAEVYDPAGPVPKDDFWRSCHDNMGNILATLRRSGPGTSRLMQSARETGTRRAQQHCPLDWVLQSWHVGGEILWQDLAGRIDSNDPHELQQLVRYASDVWGVADRFSIEMAATYQQVELELVGGTDRHLKQIIDALLDGHLDQLDDDAVRALRLDGDGRYIIVAAEDGVGYHGSARTLLQALDRHGLFSAWQLRAGTHVGVVPANEVAPERVAEILRRPAAARIGVSPVLHHLHEARSGYRMATLAMTTLPDREPAVVTLDQRLPDALLLSSPDLSQRLVASTLGPILELPAQERDELLRTVQAWVQSLGSALRAAKILYCHRNTVLNRLNRIRSLTHLDLNDADVWPQVMLALSALDQNNR